jgi:hypothetical protein
VTNNRGLLYALLSVLILFCSAPVAEADTPTNCTISDISREKRSLTVVCLISSPREGRNVLTFIDRFAGIERLSDRIGPIKLRGADGSQVPVEIRGNGVYSFNPGLLRDPSSCDMRYASIARWSQAVMR